MVQVKFKENDIIHGGILTDDGDIICGHRGELIRKDEIGKGKKYEIVEVYLNWNNLETEILGPLKRREVHNIELKGDIFIIPNHATKVKDFKIFKERNQRCADMMGYSINNPEDYLIETWYCWKEGINNPSCDNVCRHGFYIVINDKEYRIPAGIMPEDIPQKVLPEKEGESVSFIINDILKYSKEYDDESINDDLPIINATITLTANQKEYRYRSFGSWEDVIEKVTW